jgi:hypothetical protein
MKTFTVTPTATTLTAGVATPSTADLLIGGASTQEAALRYALAAATDPTTTVTFETACKSNPASATQVEQVYEATISFKAMTVGAIPINVDIFAKNFGAAVTIADYVTWAANITQVPATSFSTDFLVRIEEIFSSATVVANQVVTFLVPTPYLNADTTVNGGFSDLLILPGAGFVAGATASVTIAGTINANPPTLVVKTASTAEYIQDLVPGRTQGVGAESYVAFGIENTPGKPVKGTVMLDLLSSSLDANAGNLVSNAVRANRMGTGKVAPGAAMPGGNVTFNITPNKWISLLAGFMGVPTNTVVNGAFRTETMKPAKNADLFSFTLIEKIGDIRRVFPGSKVNSMSISVDMDSVLDATISIGAVENYNYTPNDAGANDSRLLKSTASYDSQANGIYSFTGAYITVDGVEDQTKFQNFSLTLDNMLNPRRSLNRKRTPNGFYTTDFNASVSFDLYFQDEVQMKNYMGALDKNGTWRPGKQIIFQNVQLNLTGEDCDNHQFIFNFHKLVYTTAEVTVSGNEGLILRCSGTALLSESDSSSVTLTVKHTNGASTWTKSTDPRDDITVIPFNCVCC